MHKRGIVALILAVFMFSAISFAFTDEDGDTYCPAPEAACPAELDCNDNNPLIYPGAEEIPGDGVDNDCNGIVDDACTDNDHDSYNSTASANGVSCGGEANKDCDDANMFVNPGATELCSDVIDNDCDTKIDEEDSDCAESETSDCTILEEMTSWYNCDGESINAANEGDSAYMLVFAENCDSNADVKFKIYEYSEGAETLEDTIDAQEVIENIPDEEGNPSDISVWITPWIAAYMIDDDETGSEYYFNAELTEEGIAMKSSNSGKTSDTLLSVASCDGCGVECILSMDDMFGVNYSGGTAMTPPCQKSIDCSGVSWSECDESTGKMTRDTSLCPITGTGTMECEAQIIAMTPSERMCSSSGALQKSAGESAESSCGDAYCDEGEEESCPEDCAVKEFPWLWIIIAVIAVGGLTTGIIIFYKKKKKAAAGAAKPGEKKEVMPFTAQKDLDSVLGYIRAAKGKGYKDEQITDALKKAGWKDEQIKYAFGKINNPQQGSKPAVQGATAAKPATASTQPATKSAQTAAQPAKK